MRIETERLIGIVGMGLEDTLHEVEWPISLMRPIRATAMQRKA